MSKKDADQLVEDLRSYFSETESDYTVEKRKDGHWHVVKPIPDKPVGQSLMGFASTPGDHRFRPNVVKRLRDRGIVPRDWR